MEPLISPLFVPGDRPERFAKAAETEADAVILDLEDAVAPGAKDAARRNIAEHGVTAKPLDGVTAAVGDAELAGREAARARSFGFGGKLIVHPRQIGPVRAAFLPSEKEIAWAKAVVEAEETGAGAVQIDGTMLDKPIFDRARRILERV